MIPSQYSETDLIRAINTLDSIQETIDQLIDWNGRIQSIDEYYTSQINMQLLAANCTLITAIGEGINRINRILPAFLESNFSEIQWHAIIGMRNHIAHGYFELDADLVFEAVKNDIPALREVLQKVRSFILG